MCGIIGAVENTAVKPLLIESLKQLAYRGYDSAGIATIDESGQLHCTKSSGKVCQLEAALQKKPCPGNIGIGHTRWATHGSPTAENAHPHLSQQIAIVHNGIIENFSTLKKQLINDGYEFLSDTDSEVVAHLLNQQSKKHNDFAKVIAETCSQLEGRYALAIINQQQPDIIWGVCNGSPLCIGFGKSGNYLASDAPALADNCSEVSYLENGDVAKIAINKVEITDKNNILVTRDKYQIKKQQLSEKGNYKHYMAKEIDEQPDVLQKTLTQSDGEGNGENKNDLALSEKLFNKNELSKLEKIKRIHIVACGTSYHAALVAQYWLEDIAKLPVRVEVASEMRYRGSVVTEDTLLIALSQSGETADTLAAFNDADAKGYAATLAICNRPQSSLSQQADMLILTQAGHEVGVAATKTFSCQLAALLLFTLTIAKLQPNPSAEIARISAELPKLPALIKDVLELEQQVIAFAADFVDKQHALFLGRGIHYPIAMEGALKLKEISYVHAEAYPSGELKHGPLALVDRNMPVVVVAPQDHVWQKLAANIEEVSARGASVYIFADSRLEIAEKARQKIIRLPEIDPILSPFLQTIPLQQLAYHVALIKGTDVDQPRNLAKSVTVE